MKAITIICYLMTPCLGSDPFDDVEKRSHSLNKGSPLLELDINDTREREKQ